MLSKKKVNSHWLISDFFFSFMMKKLNLITTYLHKYSKMAQTKLHTYMPENSKR